MLAATLTIDFAAFHGTFTFPVWLSVGDVDDARALLGAIIGAVSTVLALIFSVSLLVFSAAATQFGPRLMPRFLRDRMMQVTLGLFVATFLHALLTFIAVRQDGTNAVCSPTHGAHDLRHGRASASHAWSFSTTTSHRRYRRTTCCQESLRILDEAVTRAIRALGFNRRSGETGSTKNSRQISIA